jgi:hypothetical protein
VGHSNPESLPDLPDAESSCRTNPCHVLDGADATAKPDRIIDSATLGEEPNFLDEFDDAVSAPIPTHIIQGVLRVGRMTAARDTFDRLEQPDLRILLAGNRDCDTIIEAEPGAAFTVVDADTHHWPNRPVDDELQGFLATVHPRPDAAWFSHGRGLKLVFVGYSHADRALAAAFALPSSFCVELLNHTRHPLSQSSKHPGFACGPVQFFDNDPSVVFPFLSVGLLTAATRLRALSQLQMEDGGRYGHRQCPIAPGAESSAENCVVVLNGGVFCHRCAAHGVRYLPHLSPGFLPFRTALGDDETYLDLLSKSWVHWTHACIDLRHRHSNLSEAILERAYRATLRARWGDDDPRIGFTFNNDLDFFWGPGMWLDVHNLQPTIVDNDAASGLPCVWNMRRNNVGKLVDVKVDRVRRSAVKFRTPKGYNSVRPVRGISFAQDDGSIPLPLQPLPRHAIRLLDDPIPEDELWAALEESFPVLNRRYFKACLAAGICGDAGRAQPPMLACTGPSGAGKERHPELAASFMGQTLVKLAAKDDDEAFMRQIGAAIANGYRFLVLDEFGKTPKLFEKLKPVLAISSTVTWQPLYQTKVVNTHVGAAFFFPCVRFPDVLTNSREFGRRVRRAHLHRSLPDWSAELANWRDSTPENARIANSILTHTWRLCHEHRFRFL